MQINSFTSTGIASSVWANVTRTLTADPATDAGAATFVWTHAARTLTADPTPYTDITANGVSLGAGVVLDLRPAAAHRRFVSIISGSASNLLGSYDGTTFTAIGTNTSATIITTTCNNATLGMTIKNTSGGALNYWYCGWDRG